MRAFLVHILLVV